MHGIVNRSIQVFVTETHGAAVWREIAEVADLGFTDFEPMLSYERTYTPTLLRAVGTVLERPHASIMEDLGTFLVTYPGFEAVRRLLRFSGIDFLDLLQSLDDLAERARLAVPDLFLPALELRMVGSEQYILRCGRDVEGYGHLMIGVLQVMADDYGTLAVLSHEGVAGDREIVGITLVDTSYSSGRRFELARKAG